MSQESCSKGLVAGVIRRRNGSQTEKPLPRCGGTRQAADTRGRAEGWGREEWQGCSLVLFGLFKLEGNTAKPEIEDTGATTTLVADDRVGVGSNHGNAFGFALNREGRLGLRCGNLLGQRSRCNRRRSREIGRDFLGSAARRDGNG